VQSRAEQFDEPTGCNGITKSAQSKEGKLIGKQRSVSGRTGIMLPKIENGDGQVYGMGGVPGWQYGS